MKVIIPVHISHFSQRVSMAEQDGKNFVFLVWLFKLLCWKVIHCRLNWPIIKR